MSLCPAGHHASATQDNQNGLSPPTLTPNRPNLNRPRDPRNRHAFAGRQLNSLLLTVTPLWNSLRV